MVVSRLCRARPIQADYGIRSRWRSRARRLASAAPQAPPRDGHRTKLTGDDSGDVAAVEPFGEQAGSHRRNAAQRARVQPRSAWPMSSPSSSALCARSAEGRAPTARQPPCGVVDDAEALDAEAVHARSLHRPTHHIDGGERPRHRALDGLRKRVVAALGDDRRNHAWSRCRCRRWCWTIARMDADRPYPFGGDLCDCAAKVAGGETKWRRRDDLYARDAGMDRYRCAVVSASDRPGHWTRRSSVLIACRSTAAARRAGSLRRVRGCRDRATAAPAPGRPWRRSLHRRAPSAA